MASLPRAWLLLTVNVDVRGVSILLPISFIVAYTKQEKTRRKKYEALFYLALMHPTIQAHFRRLLDPQKTSLKSTLLSSSPFLPRV